MRSAPSAACTSLWRLSAEKQRLFVLAEWVRGSPCASECPPSRRLSIAMHGTAAVPLARLRPKAGNRTRDYCYFPSCFPSLRSALFGFECSAFPSPPPPPAHISLEGGTGNLAQHRVELALHGMLNNAQADVSLFSFQRKVCWGPRGQH